MIEYDAIGSEYSKFRSPEIGVQELVECAESFGHEISILDLGCGNGIPLAAKLVEFSNRYLGVDSSSVMVNEFSRNVKNAEVKLCAMDEIDLKSELFDLVFGFGSIFHLEPDRQRKALSIAADAVSPGGLLVFTSGHEAGFVYGCVNGLDVPHWSLDQDEYVDIAIARDLTFDGYWVGSGNNGFYKFYRK